MIARQLAWVAAVGLAFHVAAWASATAADYAIAPLSDAPPADSASKEIVAQLSKGGARISSGGRARFEIWLCKSLAVKPDFKPTDELHYPFSPGQLVGLVRVAEKAADFRNQDIPRGVYTLRYAQQPVDGNHVGTSATRDFLLLIAAKNDASAKPLDEKGMFKLSAESIGSKHPALLSLQPPEQARRPAFREVADVEWWIAQLAASAGEGKAVDLDLVIVGHAPE